MTYNLNNLNVASLDFDEIRSSLSTFLSEQPDLADIDFQSSGSAASMILNILATATAYNGVYAQFSYANSWPASANVRDAILGCASLASILVPYQQSAFANYTMLVGGINTGGIPAYTAFDAVGTNGSQLYFYNIETIPYGVATSVNLYCGKEVATFTDYDYVTQSIILPKEIDPATISMVVTDNASGSSVTWSKVQKGRDISGTNQQVYCVMHSANGYRVTNNMPGALEITTSSRVAVTALYSNGSLGNGASITIPADISSSQYTIPTTGYDSLSIGQLKSKFNFNLTGYQRCVTLQDYKNAIVGSGISGTEDIENVTVVNYIPATIRIYVDGLSTSGQSQLMSYLSTMSVAGINLIYQA